MPYNKSSNPDSDILSGLKVDIETPQELEPSYEYAVKDMVSDSFVVKAKDKAGKKGTVNVDISFILEGVEIKNEIKANDDTEWQSIDSWAFFGFKQEEHANSNVVVEKTAYEIDTKQMPLLTLRPFIKKEEFDKPKLVLMPTIEDNDSNVNVSFLFGANVITGNFKNGNELEKGTPYLLLDIASKTFGDYIVGGFEDVDRTFRVNITKLPAGKVEFHINFDLTDSKIILDTGTTQPEKVKGMATTGQKGYKTKITRETNLLTDKEQKEVHESKKGLIRFSKKQGKEIQLKHEVLSGVNMGIDFSFLLIDSILIAPMEIYGGTGKLQGRANKLPGGANKLPGGANKLPGGANKLPGGANKLPGGAASLPGA